MEEVRRELSVGAGGVKTNWHLADPGYLVLALLPWLVLAVDSRWIYNPLRSIDPWVYFGYFLDYPRYVAELFPDLYYGSRLPWILPAYGLHLLFDPMKAKYILHVGFYYCAVFSLYGLLRRAVGSRTALLAAVLFGTHSYFLRAIGWDYVDGAGITYNLLALVCIAQAARSRLAALWLVLSGAAAAAMFYCNAFLVMLAPFFPAFYIYQVQRGFTRTSLRLMLGFALWFASGAVLFTVLLGVVNHRAGGQFWFYGPSLQYVRDIPTPNPWYVPGWAWTPRASWLGFPLIAALGGMAYLPVNARLRTLMKRDLKSFFVLYYLGCLGIMIAWHMSGGLGLEIFYYTSYLLPSAFLALGCMFAFQFERWPGIAYWLFLATVILAFETSLRMDTTIVATHIRQAGWVGVAICAGLCSVLNGVLPNRWQMSWLILCGLWAYQAAFLGYPKDDRQGPANLSRVAESAKLVREHTGEDPVRFWYSDRDPFVADFNAINSTYLSSYAMIGRDFPAIPPQALQLGTEGVILSSRDDALEQANRALNEIHLEARALGAGTIRRDGVKYQLLFFRAEPLGAAGAEVPLKLSTAPEMTKELLLSPSSDQAAFPTERWIFRKYPDASGRMDVRADGVHVTTPRGRFSYSVQYPPFIAVKSGFYRFVLRYEDLHGGLLFGALSGDQSHWVQPPIGTQRWGGRGTRTAFASLAAGEQLVLMVSNFVPHGPDHSSTFVIKSVRAFGTFDK